MAESSKQKAVGKKRGKRNEDTLEVVCRITPYLGPDPCVHAVDDETVRFVPPPGALKRNGEAQTEKVYKFGHVFDSYDTQRDVFNRCAADFVGDIVKGRNSLLFSYGVTSSGKTYTMTGKGEGDESGILPRAADVLFNSLPRLADKCTFFPEGRNSFGVRTPAEAAKERLVNVAPTRYEMNARTPEVKEVYGFPEGMIATVFVSYVEIYNDYCYDLLDDSLTANRVGESKQVRAPTDGPAYVDKLTEVEVQSSDELLIQYWKAQDSRKVAKTMLNHQSSRSHSIFNIRLVMAPEDQFGQPTMDSTQVRVSQMSLVDLAGSERVKRTGNKGERLNETCSINESLRNLRQCFDILRKNQRSRGNPQQVPYRDQKLTLLFRSFFEGHGRIRMIVCLNPRPSDYDENSYVLDFAELAKSVDVPEASAPDLPLGEMGNLPYRRRDIVRWYGEMDNIVDPVPLDMELFEKPPEFKLDGPEDDESVRRLREHYTFVANQRRGYFTTVQHNVTEFTAKLKERLCYSDLDQRRFEDLQQDLEEQRQFAATVNARNKNLLRENNALKMRVGRYESEETNERRRDEEARLRLEKLAADAARDQRKLHNLLDVIEAPVSSIPRTFDAPTAVAPEERGPATSRVASLRMQFDQSATPTHPYPTSARRNAANFASSMTTSVVGQSGGRMGRTFANERYHRRSRSAGGRLLNHQPVHQVPTGTIIQPQFPKNTLHTTRPDMQDLRKCDEYMVTHQEVDDEGNLSTDIFKGDIVPTAGGGSSVIIKDIEKMHQEPPIRL